MRYSFCIVIAHWDDVDEVAIERGDMRARRLRLGEAAGARSVGLSRYRIAPGARAMPVHQHADEEEIFHVLAGEGVSWQDGAAYVVRAGDTIVHRAGAETHTLLASGDGELDVLAFASGSETALTWLPRPNVMWAAPRWLPLDAPHPFDAEAEAGPLEVPPPRPAAERPPTIVAHEDVEPGPVRRGRTDVVRRDLGRAAGSQRSGLKHVVIAPNAESHPPHCHTAEEELFVVLGGEGAVLLGDEALAVRAGSVVARPPGTGVAHAFAAGPAGLELLAYGQRDPGDACFYPRSSKVFLRGLGAMFRIEPADYWDGEE